jgi:hypothetical protein
VRRGNNCEKKRGGSKKRGIVKTEEDGVGREREKLCSPVSAVDDLEKRGKK